MLLVYLSTHEILSILKLETFTAVEQPLNVGAVDDRRGDIG
jgi:hypothetical protein